MDNEEEIYCKYLKTVESFGYDGEMVKIVAVGVDRDLSTHIPERQKARENALREARAEYMNHVSNFQMARLGIQQAYRALKGERPRLALSHLGEVVEILGMKDED